MRSLNSFIARLILTFALLCIQTSVLAATDTALATTRQQLSVEELQIQKQKHLDSLKDGQIKKSTLELASLELETARVALSSLELELQNLRHQLKTVQEIPAEDSTDEQKEELKNLLSHEQELIAAVMSQKSRVEVIEFWERQLSDRYTLHQSETSQQAWEAQQKTMVAERDRYLASAKKLKQQLAALPSEGNLEKTRSLRIRILEADERASLISQRIQIRDAELRIEQLRTTIPDLHTHTEQDLLGPEAQAKAIAEEMHALEQIIVRKQELLILYQEAGNLLSAKQKNLIDDLTRTYNDQLVRIKTLDSQVSLYLDAVAEQRAAIDQRKLSTRYQWPNSGAEWLSIVSELQVAVQSLAGQALYIIKSMTQQPLSLLIRTCLLILASMGLLAVIRSALTSRLPELNRAESSYSQWMSSLYVHMIRRNLYTLFVMGTVPVVAWMLGMPFEDYRVLFWILVVVMVTKPLLNLNRTLFEQRHSGLEWYDRPLYLGLRSSIVLGGALVVLSIVSRNTPISAEATEVISRLLLVGILVASSVVLWRRKAILTVLQEALEDRPRIFFLLRVASLAFPLAGVLTGFIGLLGYTNFAWMLAFHEGVVLAVASGWMTIRGFVIDFFKAWYRRSTHKMPNGWIWAQALVRPLELVTRVLLILVAISLTFYLFGWSSDSTVGEKFREILNSELFKVGESSITLASILVVAAASGVFLWSAKWSREFSYRWLYRKINDHGIRNSLAVFTQYSVVLFGFFILLKILGIDLTALAVLAGAIGVGIGFGLQTIANNFISGILLLIERPFRTGDIINIGGNEGEVTRIGIRSLSVKTWDNTEVIIPNTDTMASAFVNWTHHDNVIRVKDYVGVSYEADPHRAQEIIQQLIAEEDAIVKYPEPRVWLDAFADSSVNFRIQFFVDIDKHAHLEVKSRLWFKIWDAFKEEGIEIPYPQQDLHLRTLPANIADKFSG